MAESNPDTPSNFSSVADKEVKSPNVFERAKEEFEAIIFKSKSEEESSHHHKETHGLRNDIDENTSINDVKGPNMFERAKEEIEALVQTIHHPKKEAPNGEIRDIDVKSESRIEKKDCHSERETHGMRNDIDEKTSINDVKAPNVFERAKEEIEALVQKIHHKKGSKNESSPTNVEKRDADAKADSKLWKKDTHSEKEPKSPNFLERAKEEIEAIFHKEKSPRHHHEETHGKSDDVDENTSIEDIKGPNVFERAKEEIEAIVQAIHPK